eukprot:gnl/TRDRNA2_/TRDRNA2_198171_c0_seq1.p1 gnl/TRDRNA2_/TRDRNA2_198171_c0~~gnl/TRDRNA2_/TRDRNA2_198171_c0_seq1.p1  ORF type:complete len:323 (+),score=62.23 gnl/TRDRNA2_/TRDRNA2_198171_c0_seq1:79-1047(+)
MPQADLPRRLSASLVMLCPKAWLPAGAKNVRADGPEDYCVCLVKRSARGSFASAVVFPGGQLDAADITLANRLAAAEDVQPLALRAAALRESFEEAGLLLAEPELDGTGRSAARKRLQDGNAEAFGSFLAESSAKPATQALQKFCCFITPDFEHKRMKKGGFEAHFFLAKVPSAQEAARAVADGTEVTNLLWASPSSGLRLAEHGDISLAPPQWYILTQLSLRLPNLDGLHAWSTDPRGSLDRDFAFKPHPLAGEMKTDGVAKMDLALPGDCEHPVFPGPAGCRHRILAETKGPQSFRCLGLERTVNYPSDHVGPRAPKSQL